VEEYDGPKELRMAESQRKSERATLNGALAQVTRDFVKEWLINFARDIVLSTALGSWNGIGSYIYLVA
jgi:hypothetical protein